MPTSIRRSSSLKARSGAARTFGVGLLLAGLAACAVTEVDHGNTGDTAQQRQADAAHQRATKLQAEGKPTAAVKAMRQAVEAGGKLDYHLDYQDAAWALSEGRAEPLVETTAMRSYYAGRVDDSNSPLTPFLQARLKRLDRDWEGARLLLEEALRRAPGYFGAQYELGLLWRGVENYVKSAEWLRQAVGSAPRRACALLALAQVTGELGRWAESARSYQRYLDIVPTDLVAKRAYLTLLLYQVDGKLDRVEALVTELWRPFAKGGEHAATPDLDLQMDLAAVHWKRGRTKQAIAEYRAVIRRDPQRARAALNLGNLFYDQGQGRAKDDKKRRYELGQARKAFRYFRGLGKSADAFDWFDLELAVRVRLESIEKELGKASAKPVTWQDL